jgi:hypothetical protein
MKELQEIKDKSDDYSFYYSPAYYDPLLDYVTIVAEKHAPVTQMDYEIGCYDSKAIGNFAIRYFDNKVDKGRLNKYLESREVLETIIALGYDIEKFWYLVLFVYDYSYGFCVKGIKVLDSPKDQISKLLQGIVDNIKSLGENNENITFGTPMKIVLEKEGKHKMVIDDPLSIVWLAGACLNALETIEGGSKMTNIKTNIQFKDGKFSSDPLANSVHIWYFAKILLSFFELKPPQKARSKKGNTVSYNKMLLVSRLIYIIGLSKNESFIETEDTLKGYIKQYKNSKIDMINMLYL